MPEQGQAGHSQVGFTMPTLLLDLCLYAWLLSLGGATGSVGFESDDQATTFAQTIWCVQEAYA